MVRSFLWFAILLSVITPDPVFCSEERCASKLFLEGVRLYERGDKDSALSTLDLLLSKYASTSESDVDKVLDNALILSGVIYHELGNNKLALGRFDKFLLRNMNASRSKFFDQLVKVMNIKTLILLEEEDYEKALTVYHNLIGMYVDKEIDPSSVVDQLIIDIKNIIRKQQAKFMQTMKFSTQTATIEELTAIINKLKTDKNATTSFYLPVLINDLGSLHLLNNNNELAKKTYIDLISLYENRTEPVIRREVAHALYQHAYITKDSPQQIAAYDDLIEKYIDDHDPTLQVKIARAMIEKGHTQFILGSKTIAKQTFNLVISLYGDSQGQEIQFLVVHAQTMRDIINKTYSDSKE